MSQSNGGFNFVDVLASWAAGTDRREFNLVLRNVLNANHHVDVSSAVIVKSRMANSGLLNPSA